MTCRAATRSFGLKPDASAGSGATRIKRRSSQRACQRARIVASMLSRAGAIQTISPQASPSNTIPERTPNSSRPSRRGAIRGRGPFSVSCPVVGFCRFFCFAAAFGGARNAGKSRGIASTSGGQFHVDGPPGTRRGR